MADTPWYVDAAMLAATLYGSSQQAEAAKKAAKQQAFGTARAQQLTKEQQQALREDSQAVRQFRNQNLQELSRLNDLQTGRDGFMVSPEYRVTRDAALSVAPGANAPAGLADALSQRANDIATGEYGNYYNRRAQYTQDGANALNNLNSQIQQNTATQQGLYDQYGAQLASGKVGSANATIDGVSGILGLAGKIFGGAGGGDLLGGGIGGGTSPDGSFTMNGTTFDANGNMLAPQSNSFKISDLYSGTGVDSTGKYGYMGDLFSGGGRDGVGNYGLIGDLGGSIKDFFTDGSGYGQGQGGGAGGGINFGNLATGAGGYLLGNLIGGAASNLLGGGAQGQIGGQIASAYAKPLANSAMNMLDTGKFTYNAPDFTNVATNAVGGLVGGALGNLVGEKIGGTGGQLAGMGTQYAFNQYAMPYLKSGISSFLGGSSAGAATGATAGTATTGSTAASSATAGAASGGGAGGGAGASGLGVFALPAAMVLGSLSKRKGEKEAERAEIKAAEQALLLAGVKYDPNNVTRYSPDQIMARETRNLSPEYLASKDYQQSMKTAADFATRQSMIHDRYKLGDLSPSQLTALLDPNNVRKLQVDAMMAGASSKALTRPLSLYNSVDQLMSLGSELDSGTFNPFASFNANSDNPLMRMMANNVQQYADPAAATDLARQMHQRQLQGISGSNVDLKLLNQMSQQGLFNPEQSAFINQKILGQA